MTVDTEFLEKEYGEKIAQRKDAFETALRLFTEKFHKQLPDLQIIYSDTAATDLAYFYFYWSYILVKPFVKKLANRYKIASCTEFCIIYVKPLTVAKITHAQNRELNANFAFYMAVNIIRNFNEDAENASSFGEHILSFKGGIAPLEDRMDMIITNHRTYITLFDQTDAAPPVVLNAFVWEMIGMFYDFQWQAQAI